ncbi:MAG: SGNH/GDSL hydrolase family protein, partial [Clostridia bacterium]|nr:SGNH/GDSL hydrolase family protein [Clostridia bacterium]
RVHLAGGDWNTYTVDTVHPNDEGYSIYADVVISRLEEALSSDAECLFERELPRSLFGERSYVGAHLVDAKEANFGEGWSFVEKSLCDRYPHYYEATAPGAELRFRFTGIRLGLYWMMAKDSGDIEYSVDGGDWKHVSSWDFYCKNFNRAHRMMLTDDLERKEHVLCLRVSEKKEEESEGCAIRIGAFLVCD